MKRLVFTTQINAPVAKVFDQMLGLSSKATYEKWTATFNPTSSYKGSWTKGAKMHFLGVNDKGEVGGMVSEIEDLVPNKLVCIKHLGLLKGELEITSGPEVEGWSGMYEIYHFDESNGSCNLKVEMDSNEDFEAYMNESYPLALAALKAHCEA